MHSVFMNASIRNRGISGTSMIVDQIEALLERQADVVLDVAGMAWFERLLLQLGPEAYVVRPPELTDLAARAATKVLELYQKDIE